MPEPEGLVRAAPLEPPAQAPGDLAGSGRRLGIEELSRDADLRRKHRVHRPLRQDAAVEEGEEEAGEIPGGGQQAGRRVGAPVFRDLLGVAERVHPGHRPAREGRLPDEAGPGHPQGLEDLFAGQVPERQAGELLHHLLEIDVALAGVAEALARIGVERQFLRPPVGQAGGVGEDHPCRDALAPLVVLQAIVGKVGPKRLVQVQDSAPGELQHDGGEDRLAQGGRREDGAGLDGSAGL